MTTSHEVFEVKSNRVHVTYILARRVSTGGIDPLWIPAPSLTVDLGQGPVDYSPSEMTRFDIPSPMGFGITVTVTKSVDVGAQLFTVMLPMQSFDDNPTNVTSIEAVAVVTTIRTSLGNIGDKLPAESYDAFALQGTYRFDAGLP